MDPIKIRLTLTEQLIKGQGGYREEREHPGKEKRKRYIRRFLCILLLILCGISLIRHMANAYLAKQAEGKLQTASSFEKIYQSFERVEMKQLHLRKKWENHRGINLSIEMDQGINLSSLMSSGSAAMSVMGAVNEITGLGGYGIGHYHQYMEAVSGESTASGNGANDGWNGTDGKASQRGEANSGSDPTGLFEEKKPISVEESVSDSVAGPDQFLVHGNYIYALWLRGELMDEPVLVIYHASDGKLERVFQSAWKMGGGFEMEMMISGNYLYLVTNREYYYDEEIDEFVSLEGCVCYVYDITDPARPRARDVLRQSGDYYDMWISGDYLYVISKFQDFTANDQEVVDSYIPMVEEKKIPPKDIYMQRDLYGTGYVVIGAYRMDAAGELNLTDAKAVAGTAEMIQTSKDQIYICSQVVPKNSDHTDRTGITILSYHDGKIAGKDHIIAAGSIDATRKADVNEEHLYLPMCIHTYQSGFVEIEDWILPGWESVPLKIQMQEEAVSVERRNICVDGVGKKLHVVDVKLPEEGIREMGFVGQLFAVDEGNYIGVGHLGEEKNVRLLWFTVSDDQRPQIQTDIVVREYYSPVTEDDRMVFFDRNRALIGFCTIGSKGTFYYLYHFGQKTDTGVWGFQELIQENFGMKERAAWIRGAVLPEENWIYMVRSGSNVRIDGMVREFAVD